MQDREIAGAAADVTFQRGPDRSLVGPGLATEQCGERVPPVTVREHLVEMTRRTYAAA
jgi:hypothetical protein